MTNTNGGLIVSLYRLSDMELFDEFSADSINSADNILKCDQGFKRSLRAYESDD